MGRAATTTAAAWRIGWALDHPERVHRTAVLHVSPTEAACERADARFALAYWPVWHGGKLDGGSNAVRAEHRQITNERGALDALVMQWSRPGTDSPGVRRP